MTFKTKRNIGMILILLIFMGLVTSVWWELDRVNKAIISETSVVANNYLDVLQSFRALYTSEVIGKLDLDKVHISHEYKNIDNAIPLPATMTMMLAEKAGSNNKAMNVNLYSRYPFPWRKNTDLNDFEKRALKKLEIDSSEDIVETEIRDGELFLRVARADLMFENCVSCHNSHPDSPKTDWKVGDVRGALGIEISLDQSSFVSRNILKEFMVLIFMASILVPAIIFRLILEQGNPDAIK